MEQVQAVSTSVADISEDTIIQTALHVMEGRLRKFGQQFSSPDELRKLFVLRLGNLEAERFDVLFLNTQAQMIDVLGMFNGTLAQASVYPREIAKKALELNAAAVVFAHNHPSGTAYPSDADIKLTHVLQDALKYLDVRVLDHIVVGGIETFSFKENGLL